MNLLLFDAHELLESATGASSRRVVLEGRRAEHLRKVLKVTPGRSLRAGVLGVGAQPGRRVLAIVRDVEPGRVTLDVEDPARSTSSEPSFDRCPQVRLIVAMPRPQVLHRVLQSASAMAVERLDLVAAWRVEKSYFQSPSAMPERLRRELRLGAEQGMCLKLPEVAVHRRLMLFLDGLGEGAADVERLLPHPSASEPLDLAPRPAPRRVIVAIGPEGGWSDREVETFVRLGFQTVSLGPWILRVENAVVAALAQLEMRRSL